MDHTIKTKKFTKRLKAAQLLADASVLHWVVMYHIVQLPAEAVYRKIRYAVMSFQKRNDP